MPNQDLTLPSVIFSDVIDVKIALIVGDLPISGGCFQNPAYRLAGQILKSFACRIPMAGAARPPESVPSEFVLSGNPLPFAAVR
jgi:hypothetical protein